MLADQHRSAVHGRIALLLGLLVAAVGVIGLIGWKLELSVIKSVFPTLPSMKANTALGLLLCGASLAVRCREKITAPAHFCGMAMAALAVGLGALTLSEYLFGWELGIDQLLFPETFDPSGT